MAGFHKAAGSGPKDKRHPNDYYPTPAPVTQALLERESFPETVWEPAAGRGHMARELRRHGYRVFASELYTEPGDDQTNACLDFLSPGGKLGQSIITNPPYRQAEAFVRRAIELEIEKHAWLLRFQFIESVSRFPLFRDHPPRRLWVFSRRVQVSERGLVNPVGGMIVYAWWVWERGYVGSPELKWIPPGFVKGGI